MKQLILSIVCCSLISTACSSSVHDIKDTKVGIKESKVSLEDQAIIKKYKDLINSLDFHDRALVDKTMRDSLSEISKIQDKYEREKIQMNIYLSTGMYQEAYNLNSQILRDYPFIANRLTQCELIYILKLSKEKFEKCHAELALAFKKELDITSKSDPEYSYGEWGYLLSMYKAGHKEYKQKMQNFINSTSDETTKFQFKNSYELAIQQSERD